MAIHYFQNAEAANETLRLVRKNGSDGLLIQADVTRSEQVSGIFDEVRRAFGALAPRRITVNAVSPGWTEDSVMNTLPAPVQELIRTWHTRGWTPMGRLGTPADIGNVVGLLCDDEANWITGQVIFADGASLMNPEMPSEIQLPQPREAAV